ncbi:DUF2851 family protein [Butyricimonas synergistica]|uniref:DUF2851 family protein n=1 Tax=Butyricimonas synergistica TaxID=544644 RepID=UPI000367FF58|nr:DUF2851 family protein [Butyricimonas synergistica]
MTEEFLQYVWANSLFTSVRCFSTKGKEVEILNVGFQNRDAGPDFFSAKVRIDYTVLVGNVEIHQKASDWFRHGHEKDAAYDNVILSVVEDADMEVYNSRDREIDAIILRYDPRLWDEYVFMQGVPVEPRCYRNLRRIDSLRMDMLLAGYGIERLERKCGDIKMMLEETMYDWEACFYRMLVRYWSGNVNADAFAQLAQNLSYKKVIRCSDSLFRVEALLLGYSGLLSDLEEEDDYTIALREEYEFQAAKFHLTAMQRSQWKYMRIRPTSFPTVRLALLAALMMRFNFILSTVLETERLEDIYKLLDVQASKYWSTHYKPGVLATQQVKRLGNSMKTVIVINAIVPFLFVYGKERKEERYCDKAVQWLEELEAERNHVTETWTKQGVKLKSALQSQALLQIKREYCDAHQCLHCRVGSEVFRSVAKESDV